MTAESTTLSCVTPLYSANDMDGIVVLPPPKDAQEQPQRLVLLTLMLPLQTMMR